MAKMSNEQKKNKINELETLFEEASLNDPIVGDLIAHPEDLINDEIMNYDYEQDLSNAVEESKVVIDSMASLYLNDNEKILNHPYLQNKRTNDSNNHADMTFLQNVAKKAIIKQLEQMDQGDLSPRHFETFYNGMKEMRENIKQATTTQATMESFYKAIRGDLGLTGNIGGAETQEEVTDETKDDNLDLNMADAKDLNSQIDEILKQRHEKEKNKK